MTEGVEYEAQTHFFRIYSILSSRVPRTLKEFVIVVATEDLYFFRSLSIADRRCLFLNASYTFFRVRSMVFMVATDQEDVLGSSDLSNEWYELKEKCETLERVNYIGEKYLV